MTLILLIGLPGSGKTTLRNGMFADKCIICPDDLIGYSKDQTWSTEVATEAWKKASYQLTEAFERKESLIVFDSTMLGRKKRGRFIRRAAQYKYKTVAIFCDTPIEICRERNNTRDQYRKVPENTLCDMHNRLEPPTVSEGFSLVVSGNSVSGTIENVEDIEFSRFQNFLIGVRKGLLL